MIDRAARGEQITITRAGKDVAELRPVSASPLSAQTLLTRWRGLPAVDPDSLRHDIDEILDARV